MDNSNLDRAAIFLEEDALLKIRRGQGQSLLVVEGLVWVTQTGDPRDVFLAPNEFFVLNGPGRTIVQALEPSRLLVLAGE
jgi:hypothetical protein